MNANTENLVMQKSHCKRILLIGLDGFTWKLGRRLIEDGHMPTLKGVVERGSHGNLRSVFPFETSPAWAAFQTGCRPNNTGIYSFHTLDRKRNMIRLNSHNDILSSTLWEILNSSGKKTICINMPLTSPPPPINGVIIPGLLCPNLSPETTFPTSVYDQFIKPHPSYKIVNNEYRDTVNEFARQSCETEQVRCQVALELMDQNEWDLLYFQIQSTDLFQHRYWWALDPNANGFNERDYAIASDFYRSCDTVLSQLIKKAGPETAVFVVSDHGFTKQRYALSLNRWLFENGYLILKPKVKTRWEEVKEKHSLLKALAHHYGMAKIPVSALLKKMKNLYLRKSAPPFSEIELLHLRQSIDLEHSTAFCLGAMGALIFVNSRFPNKDNIVRNIQKKLLNDFGISAKTPLIKRITTGLDQYGPSKTGATLPDLVVEYQEGVSTIVNPLENEIVKCYAHLDRQPGTHNRDGIFVVEGENIRRDFHFDADIVDIVPTLLAYWGIAIPENIDGSVLRELFVNVPDVRTQNISAKPCRTILYSDKQQSDVEKRLTDLGYL